MKYKLTYNNANNKANLVFIREDNKSANVHLTNHELILLIQTISEYLLTLSNKESDNDKERTDSSSRQV